MVVVCKKLVFNYTISACLSNVYLHYSCLPDQCEPIEAWCNSEGELQVSTKKLEYHTYVVRNIA